MHRVTALILSAFLVILLSGLFIFSDGYQVRGAEYFSDTFTRTTSNGWGTSDSGHTYSASTSNYAVNGSEGTISVDKGVTRVSYPVSISQQDVLMTTRFKVDQIPTGANQSLSIVSRNVGGNNLYRTKIILSTNSVMYVNFSYLNTGSETDIGSYIPVPGIAITADTYYWVKTEVSGASPTTLKVKVWADGTTEPPDWLYSVTNSQAGLQTAGGLGFSTYVSGSSSVTPVIFSFDDFTVESAPSPTPTPTPYTAASDSFNRTVVNGWNYADTGGLFTTAGSSPTDYSVNGSEALMTATAPNASHRAYLNSVETLNSDQTVKFKTSKLAEGSTMYATVLARTDSSLNDEYFLQTLLRTTNRVAIRICKLVSGSETCLTDEFTVPDLTHETDDYIWLRFQVSGSSPTTLKGKAWKDGWKEPLDWQVSTTDSEAVLQSAAQVGVTSFVSASATNTPLTFSFDDYTLTDSITSGVTPAVSGSSANKGAVWHNGSWHNTALAPGAYYWPGIYGELKRLRNAGVRYVRFLMDSGTQSSCGEDKYYSYIRDAFTTYELEGLVTIRIPNPTTTTATDEEREEFRDWLTTMVTCYKDDFDNWEIGNEPNLSQFWNIDDDPDSDQAAYEQSVGYYYTFLEDAYDVIKGIDPDATVIHAGLSQSRLDRWLDAATVSASPDSFDAMGFHPYSDYDSEGNVNQVNRIYKWLQQTSGMSSKPIWITEVGYTANATTYPGNTGGSESIKATNLTEAYQDLRRWGITTPIFWYDASQLSGNPTQGYQLMYIDRDTNTYTLRPAYTAMQDLWDDYEPVDTTTAPSQIVVLTTNTTATVSWRTSDIASGQLQYGKTSATQNTRPVINELPLRLAHTDTITGLESCTEYKYQLTSQDVDDNSVTSSVRSFTTTGCPDTTDSSESHSTTSTARAPQCTASTPTSIPEVVRVQQYGERALLTISSNENKDITEYAIKFGRTSAADEYGMVFSLDAIAGETFTVAIDALDPLQSYYFAVRAGHDCAPGEWSNAVLAERSSADSKAIHSDQKPSISVSVSPAKTSDTTDTHSDSSPVADRVSSNDQTTEMNASEEAGTQHLQSIFRRMLNFVTHFLKKLI